MKTGRTLYEHLKDTKQFPETMTQEDLFDFLSLVAISYLKGQQLHSIPLFFNEIAQLVSMCIKYNEEKDYVPGL